MQMNTLLPSLPVGQTGGTMYPVSGITSVCIIGEGRMGTSIFYYLADFGFRMVWLVSREADAEKMRRQFNRKINRSFEAGIIGKEALDALQQTIISADPETAADCHLIIEAIPENRELKRDLFLKLDAIANHSSIFASNSSSVNPSLLSPDSDRRERFIGLHFFYPVPLKNIIEVTLTHDTSWETLAMVESFLAGIRRRFITLDEKNSFMLNRIFLDFQNEAFLSVHSGQGSYRQMDHLVKKNFFSFGVFDFCDNVGLDIMLSSILNYTRNYPNKKHYSQFIGKLTELVSQGNLGMKTKKGFYNYPLDESPFEEPVFAPELVDHLRETWLSSAKTFIAQANIPVDDANHAIREYFDLIEGPFE